MEHEMLFSITTELGNPVCEPMMLTFSDIYWIHQTFVCEVSYGHVVLY